jgi:hypothetical protein
VTTGHTQMEFAAEMQRVIVEPDGAAELPRQDSHDQRNGVPYGKRA